MHNFSEVQMGGNVEAYYEARAEAEQRNKEMLNALLDVGLINVDGKTVVLTRAKITNRYGSARPTLIVGHKGKVIFSDSRMNLEDVSTLVKALGFKIRSVQVQD
jgi:hypothetical protein